MSDVLRDDIDFARRFERLELDPATFGHREHVRAAYGLLAATPFAEATQRYVATLRALTAAVPDKLHLTVTIAFLALIAERMHAPGVETAADLEGFEAFAAAHPELLSPDALAPHYTRGRLDSPLARRVFLLPDRPAAGPGGSSVR